ncbi:MAG: 3'-5' exonuclease family protein [Myxococcales bacterium]
MSSLLLELVLHARDAAPPLTSFALGLTGAYAVEIDERGRRLRSHRLALAGHVEDDQARAFPDEASLLREVVSLLAHTDCLITAQGRQLELPALEALAMRHAVPLPGQFDAGDPYQARRSPYNLAHHLDLASFLADGDRRLRGLFPELLLGLAFPEARPPPRRAFVGDTLAAARERALGSYLLYLRVQRLRGVLAASEVRQRLDELVRTGVALSSSATGWAGEPAPPPDTRLTGAPPGVLAFDIETVLDAEAVVRCLGRPAADPAAALGELLGAPTGFAPAPFHRVVAIALCHWDPKGGRVELERLRLGGASGAGAPLSAEVDLLAAFWHAARGQRLLSYNGKRFDLPVLLYRSLPHPIELPWYLASQRPPYEQYRHPQSARQLDLFDQLGGGLSPGPLGDVLHSVGLPGKLGPDGGDVQALWDGGQGEAIGDYCLQDAAQTLLLGLRFLRISGELDAEAAGAAVSAARQRFAREPALAGVLAQAGSYFEAGLKR